jgi:hypothetical protein
MAKSDVMAATPKQRKAPKQLSHLELHEGENGGHVVHHVFTHYDHPTEHHVFGASEGSKLVDHIVKHGNIKLDAEAAAGTEENVAAKEKAQL